MLLRHVPLIIIAFVLLSGCAQDYGSRDRRLSHSVKDAAAPVLPAAPVPYAPPQVPPATVVSWGEPAVHPIMPSGPRAVAGADGPYLLDTGDRLRIFVYGQPNLSRIYPVDHSGKITIPLIGRLHARGRTTRGLEALITRKLGAQYVKDPQVNVDMAQNRPFFILGEVRSPGQYPYVSGITVQGAVAIAGGYSERANERKVEITRRINGYVEKMEVPDDYVIKPGDTVKIPERFL